MKITKKLMTAAIHWAEVTAQEGLRKGRKLRKTEARTARKMGVTHPELIRLVVGPVPSPTSGLLKAAFEGLGIGEEGEAMALGYAIFMSREPSSPSDLVFSHECRHVSQYESQDDLASFVTEFMRQFAMYGYLLAPWEVDARHSVSLLLK